ncbi:MAG: hypothetical protein ABIJ97_04915 [Bacteroidota bacterium]
MNITKYWIILIIFSLIISSCKDNKEYKLKLEKEKLSIDLNCQKVLIYKTMKVLVRSSNASSEDSEITSEILSIFNGTQKIEKITARKIYRTIKKYNKLRKSVLKLNEDDYPTALYSICSFTDDSTGEIGDFLNTNWNSATEHAVFSVLLNNIPEIPSEYALYEASLIKPDSLPANEFQAIIEIYRAIIMSESDYNYTAEDILTKNINNITSGKVQFIEDPTFDSTKKPNKYSSKNICLALSHLFRGIVRTKTDADKNDIRSDFETFIELMENTGLHKDLSLVAGLYLAQIDKDQSKTNNYLEKLSNSDLYDEAEKKSIKKLSRKIKNGNMDIEEIFSSEYFNPQKVLKDYVVSTAMSSDYITDISKSNYGDLVFSIPENMVSLIKWVEDAGNVKKYLEKGKKILDLFI